MYKILIAIICVSLPALCMAEDFNYDDDTKIDVTDDNWDNTDDDGTAKPGINVEFDNPTTSIQQVGADSDPLQVSRNGSDLVRVSRNGTDLVIVSATDTIIPIYHISSATVQMLPLRPGINNHSLPRGLYIINARKYAL